MTAEDVSNVVKSASNLKYFRHDKAQYVKQIRRVVYMNDVISLYLQIFHISSDPKLTHQLTE